MKKFRIPKDLDRVEQERIFKYGDQINYQPIIDDLPLFSYIYLMTYPTDKHSFQHSDISINEYKLYFNHVFKISNCTIKDLCEGKYRKEYNFRIDNSCNKNIKEILKKVFNVNKLEVENIPPMGHFHLLDRKTEKTANTTPVVHFFIGSNGTFYILCLDLRHEIHKCNIEDY